MTPPGRARSRRGQGEALREEILACTQSLLLETGSEDSVSIRAVADAVGVTPPSIYRHFEDKDMLLLETCRLNFTQFADALGAVATDGPLHERMALLGRAYIAYAVEHPEHYRLMFMARFELTAQEYAEEMIGDSSFALLLDTTAELIRTGWVRPDLAAKGPLHVGVLFWATVHGLASLFVAKPGLPWPDRDELVDDVIDLAVRGIQLDPDERRARLAG